MTMLQALVEAAQWFGEEGPVQIEATSKPEPMVRVFRASTQLDDEAAAALFLPRSPGTGGGSKVGLYAAKGLAEAHGGRLEAETNGGIAFTLTLPSRKR
jgi:signal transduction histidine kinase